MWVSESSYLKYGGDRMGEWDEDSEIEEWYDDEEEDGLPPCFGDYACGCEECDFCEWCEECMEESYPPGTYDDWDDELSCDSCGPWCEYWVGDGLCELVIQEQTRQMEEYEREHHRTAKCPVCGEELEEFDVKANEIWVWDPSWYDPMIALDVYGPMWLRKDVIHQKEGVYHVWIEFGDGRKERLIRLIRECVEVDE